MSASIRFDASAFVRELSNALGSWALWYLRERLNLARAQARVLIKRVKPVIDRLGLDPLRKGTLRLALVVGLVIVHPVWNYGFPAILKGYFDRVWRPGVAFEQPPGGGLIKPALRNLTRMGVVTTCGAPWLTSTLNSRFNLSIIISR